MKRKFLLLMCAVALIFSLASCDMLGQIFGEEPAHEHTFADATCTAPKTCSCGATEGEALGHTFAPATCTAPKTCACGATEGTALGHTFAPATCTAPKTCSCGATEGAALGHTFVDGTCACGATDPNYVPHTHSFAPATCTAPKTCSCGATEGDPLPHDFAPATCTAPKTCSCGATEGDPLPHDFAPATCTAPKTCACGATEGDPLPHDFAPATCTAPKTCACGATEGNPLPHNYVDGKCECGAIDPDHTHNYTTGICDVCGAPNLDYAASLTPPAAPNSAFLEGTWFGAETGDATHPDADANYEGNHTFVITLDASGRGTVKHSLRGTLNVYSCVINGNTVSMYTTVGGIHLTYDASTGTFTLRGDSGDMNFTKGTYLQMVKVDGNDNAAHECEHVCATCGKCTDADCADAACADKCQGHTVAAPEDLTPEYLIGTWYGKETAWGGAEHTFTLTINDDRTGVVEHSGVGTIVIDSIMVMDNDVYLLMYDYDTMQVTLTYSNGVFTVMEGTSNFTEGDFLTMSKTAPAPAHECEHVCDECGKCTDADCTEDACADKCEGHTPAAPSELTEEYLVGTWTGTEVGGFWYSGTYTFTITFNADGSATMTHSQYGDVTIIDYYIEGNALMIMCSAENSSVALEYANGSFTVLEGGKNFTYGTELTMTKAGATPPAPAHECEHVCDECGKCTDADCAEDACADKCEGHTAAAPENLTPEYFVGTWTGSETGASWGDYVGDHTFTVTINSDLLTGTVNHSLLGEFAITNITFMSTNVVMMELDSPATFMLSIEYNNGVFTLAEGSNFSYGREYFTMTKGEPAPAPAHECEHVCDECGKCTDSDCTEDACADKCEGHAPAAPAIPDNLTSDYLIGTWTGTEKDYMKDTYTLSITFMDNGTAVVLHQTMGQLTLSYTLYGNELMLNYDGIKFFLDYNNGELSLQEGYNSFTQGTYLVIAKATEEPAPAHECEHVCDECGKCTDSDCAEDACADKCQGHTPAAPEFLDYEYLTGTWTGTETSWNGTVHTFTIEFDGQMGTVTHSELGTFDVIVEISYGMIMAYPDCEYDMSYWMYADGTITLMDGMNSFTGGETLTMTKTA